LKRILTTGDIEMSKDVFILGGKRTPMGEYVGVLKDVSAIDLGAVAARGALESTGVQPDEIRPHSYRQCIANFRRRDLWRSSRCTESGRAIRSSGTNGEPSLCGVAFSRSFPART
jgi:hypothetical protein